MRVQAPASPFSPAKAPKATWSEPSRTASSFPSAGSDVAIGPPNDCLQPHFNAAAADKKSHTMALTLAALVAVGSMMSAGMHCMYSAAPSSYAVKRSGYSSVAQWRANAAGVNHASVRLHACIRVREHSRTCMPCSGMRPVCKHAHVDGLSHCWILLTPSPAAFLLFACLPAQLDRRCVYANGSVTYIHAQLGGHASTHMPALSCARALISRGMASVSGLEAPGPDFHRGLRNI